MTHLSTFEDFSIGQVLKSGPTTITEDEIIKYNELVKEYEQSFDLVKRNKTVKSARK